MQHDAYWHHVAARGPPLMSTFYGVPSSAYPAHDLPAMQYIGNLCGPYKMTPGVLRTNAHNLSNICVAKNASHDSVLKLPRKRSASLAELSAGPAGGTVLSAPGFGWSPQAPFRVTPNKRRRMEPKETPQDVHAFSAEVTTPLQPGKYASSSPKDEAVEEPQSKAGGTRDPWLWADVYGRPRIVEADFTPLPPLDAPVDARSTPTDGGAEVESCSEELDFLPASVVSAQGERMCSDDFKPMDVHEETVSALRSQIERTERRHARMLSKRIALEAELITSRRDEAILVSEKYRETITAQDLRARVLEHSHRKLKRQCSSASHQLQKERRRTAVLRAVLGDEQVALADAQASVQRVSAQLDTLRDAHAKHDVASLRDENAELRRQLAKARGDAVLRCRQKQLGGLPTRRLKELRAECRKLLANVDAEHEHRLKCVVCMDARANVTTAPCAHSVMCEECLVQLKAREGNEIAKCPLCRAVITGHTRHAA